MKGSESAAVGDNQSDQRPGAFGRALDEAMRQEAINAPAVARHVGLSDDAVRKWLSGKSEPAPHVVFAVEELLGVAPGDLSRHLGYVPVGTTSVTAAIAADQKLSPKDRRILIRLYRESLRHDDADHA